MSTSSYNVDYQQQPSTPIQELKKRAYVNKADTERYSVKKWVNSVSQLYQQGELAVLNNEIESAYVSYMRGCSIMVGIIQVHSQFKDIYKDPIYVNLKKKTSNEIFPLLEDLSMRIDAWYNLSRQSSPSPAIRNNNPAIMTDSSTHFNVSPINHVATSTASYAFRPSHDPRNYPHYTLNDVPINTNQITSPNGILYPSSSSSSASLTPHQPNMNVNNLTQSLSNQLRIKDKSAIPLPKWTSNNFPNTLIVQSLELANWVTSKHNPPSILIVDVRPREIFTRGCIKHQWIIQIDPSVLSYSDQYSAVKGALAQNPNAEQVLFEEISNFDLVVYYDQSSKALESASIPLLNLRKVLDVAGLRRPAMMLAGGYDAWFSSIGERGVYKFPSEKKHWFRNSNSSGTTSSSQSSHHGHNPVYDYFTGKTHHHHQQYNAIPKPMPIPTAPRKESLTSRYHETLSPTVEKTITYPSQQSSPALIQHPQEQQQQQQQQVQNLQPVPPSYPKLHRRRTFIDNPFNGFTTTTNSLYDVPPIAYQNDKPTSASTPATQEQRPSSAEPINRPTTLHNLSASNLHAKYTTSDFTENRHLTSVGKTGLKNLGNTCYMNSILQCLSGTVPFIRFFTSGMYKQHINRVNKRGSGGVLVDSFANLIREMWSEKYNFISPMSFRDVLGRCVPQFKGTDQQDSQEFLVVLMDKLHEDMNEHSEHRVPSPTNEEEFERLPDWKASLIAWERYLSQHQSIIVSLFQGQYRSRLTCLSCKNTSTTYNAFMSLSVPIPVKKMRLTSVTLQQCLDAFVKEETLDKEDGWNCPKCKKKRKALKQLTLTRLPDILMIHLKRFSADGLFRNKLDATVKCPTRGLDLSNYVPSSVTPPSKERPSFVYDLYAVSNHFGSLSGGHYTACVRDMLQNNWSYFDDSRITLCDESKVVTKAAYNLFYVRSTVKS